MFFKREPARPRSGQLHPSTLALIAELRARGDTLSRAAAEEIRAARSECGFYAELAARLHRGKGGGPPTGQGSH